MTRSWMLAAPAALALLAGCASDPVPAPRPAPVPIVAAPPVYVPPATSMAEPEAAPVRTRRRVRAVRRVRPSAAAYGGSSTAGTATAAPGYGRGLGAPAVNSEQTTSGPSAVGRRPAPAQPVGSGGS